jgi:hypothetical protein
MSLNVDTYRSKSREYLFFLIRMYLMQRFIFKSYCLYFSIDEIIIPSLLRCLLEWQIGSQDFLSIFISEWETMGVFLILENQSIKNQERVLTKVSQPVLQTLGRLRAFPQVCILYKLILEKVLETESLPVISKL